MQAPDVPKGHPVLFFMERLRAGSKRLRISAILAQTIAAFVGRDQRRRCKLFVRECHFAKCRAGVVVHGRHTFLFGNAVFGSLDKILTGTFYANYREKSECYEKTFTSVRTVGESAVYHAGNIVGYLTTAATFTATAVIISHAYRQYNGINGFKHDRR